MLRRLLADSGGMPFGLKVGGLRRWNANELREWTDAGCKPVRSDY